MKNKNKNKIKVLNNPEFEMAGIFYNNEPIFIGNYWDFKPGCQGEEFKIGKKVIEVEKFSSFLDLAEQLASELEAEVEAKNTEEEFW